MREEGIFIEGKSDSETAPESHPPRIHFPVWLAGEGRTFDFDAPLQ